MSGATGVTRHPLYGPAIPERGWVPAPTYVLRRRRVLHLLSDRQPGRIVEVGSGAGAMLADLSRLGFRCDALESSAQARELARIVNADDDRVAIHDTAPADWRGAFDTVLAMEVLEHIEDDSGALRSWAEWLRPGGVLLLSVPAHPRMWNASDVWAGHYRRYTRDGLRRVVEEAGLAIEHLECYGFPLSNIIDPVRARVHARKLREEGPGHGRAHGSARSGTERGLETRLYPLQASWAGGLAMRFFFAMQYVFRGTDLGTGYIMLCGKPE
jgi:SAM-dependent methyltransferase